MTRTTLGLIASCLIIHASCAHEDAQIDPAAVDYAAVDPAAIDYAAVDSVAVDYRDVEAGALVQTISDQPKSILDYIYALKIRVRAPDADTIFEVLSEVRAKVESHGDLWIGHPFSGVGVSCTPTRCFSEDVYVGLDPLMNLRVLFIMIRFGFGFDDTSPQRIEFQIKAYPPEVYSHLLVRSEPLGLECHASEEVFDNWAEAAISFQNLVDQVREMSRDEKEAFVYDYFDGCTLSGQEQKLLFAIDVANQPNCPFDLDGIHTCILGRGFINGVVDF